MPHKAKWQYAKPQYPQWILDSLPSCQEVREQQRRPGNRHFSHAPPIYTFLEYLWDTLHGIAIRRDGMGYSVWDECYWCQGFATLHTRPHKPPHDDSYNCWQCGAWGDELDTVLTFHCDDYPGKSVSEIRRACWEMMEHELRPAYLKLCPDGLHITAPLDPHKPGYHLLNGSGSNGIGSTTDTIATPDIAQRGTGLQGEQHAQDALACLTAEQVETIRQAAHIADLLEVPLELLARAVRGH